MFNPPYRAAVIGRTGRGGYGHEIDRAMTDPPKLKLVAVADDDPEGLASAVARLGAERGYADYREMLDREKPQFVAIASRWLDGHRDMAVACAERGIHVFCEKPMAPTLADCDAIVTACERSHTKLAVAFQTRYSPQYDRVRELIAEGAIGEVLEVRGRGKEDRRGGGEDLMVLGVHIMDLFRGLLGESAWCFARVTEAGRPIGPADVRDGAEGIGPLAGDRADAMYGFVGKPAVAHFATARPREPGQRFGVQILGSKGRIDLGTGWAPHARLLADPAWSGAWAPGWVEITGGDVGNPDATDLIPTNRRIVADLIRAVETDSQPLANVYDGRAAVEMVLACYASQARGGPVTFPLADRARHPLETLG
ncbi:Gfo/Idh/MocA family protein [Planctomyces sp. SH-PL62]|uniref:Gfo/Idh/MocA family protein n=1 Tax=Planctomyces sp. SH-PL62 TaxID=1636152 RepID=UPI00078B2754|nr:Gfo/Idh/MocA family oxidoreductase [Planctomyces sp. SH-PL62]AMV36055.1 Glucose-6-phosphate 3-dehydrogenase [Planctomyces sp. SH-PL62]